MPEAPKELVASLAAVEELLRDDSLAPWPTREDDLALLHATRERLERRFTLAVVGEFSSGKSYLLNALLGKTRYDDKGRITGLLATDINPSTATITELEYGASDSAVAKYASGRSERIPLDRLARFVAVGKDEPGGLHDATADEEAAPSFVVVSVDSPFLRRGFVVADTPGLASLNAAHRRATLAYLPRADAVLYLIDTQQPFTEGDAAFLGLIGEHVRTIFIVQTKIDLWRMPEADGVPAWESARARIVARAARFAPDAAVYSVSARDYAAGTLDADAQSVAASGFPELLEGLERTLEARAQSARTARTMSVLRQLSAKTARRIQRAAALGETSQAGLLAERQRALTELTERERALGRERDDIARAGDERRHWVREQGRELSERAIRALGAAIDVADIARIRDRGKLHALVDAAVAPVWTAFAADVAGHVARALDRISKSRADWRIADMAALRLGGEPGTGAWSRELSRGIASTIVLGAIGGPALDFVAAVARGFGAHAHGAYMKRELGADLYATLFPAFERDVLAFVGDLSTRIGGIYDDAADAVERERSITRAETLHPIEQALERADKPAERRAALAALGRLVARLGAIESQLLVLEAAAAAIAAATSAAGSGSAAAQNAFGRNGSAGAPAQPVFFDPDWYDRGLRPERYRIVVLGALRRGKSSLINAIAGTRLLQDDACTEALFPLHVRYGERERAYALEGESTWTEIETSSAMTQAARSPVLIETPWSMPHQLVLVHAPAFDSGNERAEEIALAAAGAASEVLGLFSRQLSDRELALYARVAELERPMLLAHTIADNESSAERRTVVELAGRYLRERAVPVSRIFTISALDYFDAAQTKRRPAPWNELAALRDTLAAHAEEHMRKVAERERRAAQHTEPANVNDSSEPKLRRALERLFGPGKIKPAPESCRVLPSYTLGPARIALGTGAVRYGRLAIENGRIADILSPEGSSDVRVPEGATLAPGMIDVHTNGAGDVLFNRDQGNAVDIASQSYAAQGATGFVATVMTAPWESMLHAATEAAEAAHQLIEHPVATGARCLGVHFEGPFLNPKFRRVHRHDWLLPASLARAKSLVEACHGALVMATMAPEVEGVEDVTRFFFDQGIVCSAGHTAAKYRDGKLAIGLGFRTLTHAFNAMPPLDHREPSILAAFIQEERSTVQVICDGFHVAPVMIDVLYRTLGDRLVLATDYMAPAGSGYRIEGGVVRAEDGTIAGSALHMDRALRNLMSYASIPFERAIVNASATPALLLGLDRECGTIAKGKRADIVVWDASYEILTTFVCGEPVYGTQHLARTRATSVG